MVASAVSTGGDREERERKGACGWAKDGVAGSAIVQKENERESEGKKSRKQKRYVTLMHATPARQEKRTLEPFIDSSIKSPQLRTSSDQKKKIINRILKKKKTNHLKRVKRKKRRKG